MSAPATSFGRIHLRRSLTSSRAYLVLGLALPLLMIAVSVLAGRSSSSALALQLGLPASVKASAALLFLLLPTMIPLAAVIGCFSPLLLFVNDRSRGVYEYLLAFGKRPGDIFSGLVVSVLAICGILLAVPIVLGTFLFAVDGPVLLPAFALEVAVYSVPMGLLAPLLVTGIAALWVSLTKRIQFVNSPIGIAPMFGMLPVLVVFIASEFVGAGNILLLTAVVSGLTAVVTAAIYVLASRLLGGERFIV